MLVRESSSAMESLIEQISEQLPEAQSQSNFSTLLKIFSNVLEHPNEAKFQSLSKAKLEGKLHGLGLQVLAAAGFVDQGTDLVLPAGANLEAMQGARELLECLALSFDDAPLSPEVKPAVAPAAVVADGDEDAELAEAMRLSMAGQQSSEQQDRQMAEEVAREEEPVSVDFQRFDRDVVIDDDAVDRINEFCRASGEPYVDPQFPPLDRSLYMDETDARTWDCLLCHARTELPPVPPLAKSREEAEAAEAFWQTKNKCSGCGQPAHHVVTVRYFGRPTQWLRPGVRCMGCEMIYSHLPGGRELTSRMCPHFLRDSMSNTTVGAPWKLIRGEARAEDVCQGGLGNCWFAGALSTVARVPELIDNMFITKEFNPHGAYHLRLCHAGEWRSILIDDLQPTSQLFQGYLDGTTAYYSQGGNLCYLQGARRQIWVPLVEKAAAKLYGCWAALKGGTVGEAMAMFTGFPTQRIGGLYIRKAARQAIQERRQAKADERTRLLLQGAEVPDDMGDSDEDFDNDSLTWSKILSANDAGYLMGMGCTEEGCEKTKNHIVEEMGLQCPHAYGVLDAREVQVNGKLTRFLKMRNPWGERAPRTWKGRWNKDDKNWTFDLQFELGIVNRSGVKMDEDMGIFWMCFEDVKEYFNQIEVCRVHQTWHTTRCKAWLPSGVGPGDAFDLTIFRKTQVDLVVWQEKNIQREGALGARSTNVDVGLAVLRKRSLGEDGQPVYELIEYIHRTNHDDCSGEIILEGGFVYRLVPICFGMMQEYAPRRCVVAVHSVQQVELQKVPSSWHDVACGAFEGCRKGGKRRPVQTMGSGPAPGLSSYLRFEEGCGACFAVENTSDMMAALQFDGSECEGCNFTRGTSVLVAAVPPRSRQVLMGISVAQGAGRFSMSFGAISLGAEAAAFAVQGEDMHMSVPLLPAEFRSPTHRPVPDDAILKRAPPEEPEPQPSPKRANTTTDDDADTMLAEALRMSMMQQPQATSGNLNEMQDGDDDEDELAAAVRMSMAQQPQLPAAAGTSSSAAAAAPQAPAPAAATGDQKAELTALIKRLFEEYRRSGMNPNDAASKAMTDAKRQLGAG